MIQRGASHILNDVIKNYHKMAFLSGPRQVGKTTLAQSYLNTFSQGLYFNWDVITDQKKLLKDPYFFQKENRDPQKPFLVVFDEIHKYTRWKNYLKGVYDQFKGDFRFLITGSSRLDLFKKGGDSLLGRYMSVPLLPLTLGELNGNFVSFSEFKKLIHNLPPPSNKKKESYQSLFHHSGFPEPLIHQSERFYNSWFQDRKNLLIREDIRNASLIRELSQLEMLSHLIPERVGVPLSLNSLREDIGVSFESIRDWVLLLEQFFYLFRLTPYVGTIARSLKKEAKVYLYDWVEVPSEGYRFENMVALHLLKAVRTWRACGEGNITLHYLRDKEKHEVDFIIVENKMPICLIECKFADENFSPSLSYYQEKLSVPIAIQLVHKTGVSKKIQVQKSTRFIVSADQWLNYLP